MFTSEDYLRKRLEDLKAQRADVVTLNGRKWLPLPPKGALTDRRVPVEFLEKWIKFAEIDLGLEQGRAMEDYRNENV